MTGGEQADYYEILQVSRNADTETISGIYRFLAKRYHPDGPEGGDPDRFSLITEAFRVLTDPEKRVAYDAKHERIRQDRWRVLTPDPGENDIRSDNRVRTAILSLLYAARRQSVDKPGMGIYELERVLDCPSEHMKFHIWYLKEQGWIARLEDGQFAVTVDGVDKVTREGADVVGPLMLRPGDGDAE
jgi:curved DNA-binding protein CbpA